MEALAAAAAAVAVYFVGPLLVSGAVALLGSEAAGGAVGRLGGAVGEGPAALLLFLRGSKIELEPLERLKHFRIHVA